MFEILIGIVICVIIIAILILLFVFWNKRECEKSDNSIEKELLNNKILNNNIYEPKLKGGFIKSDIEFGKLTFYLLFPSLLETKDLDNIIIKSIKDITPFEQEVFNQINSESVEVRIREFNKLNIDYINSINYNIKNFVDSFFKNTVINGNLNLMRNDIYKKLLTKYLRNILYNCFSVSTDGIADSIEYICVYINEHFYELYTITPYYDIRYYSVLENMIDIINMCDDHGINIIGNKFTEKFITDRVITACIPCKILTLQIVDDDLKNHILHDKNYIHHIITVIIGYENNYYDLFCNLLNGIPSINSKEILDILTNSLINIINITNKDKCMEMFKQLFITYGIFNKSLISKDVRGNIDNQLLNSFIEHVLPSCCDNVYNLYTLFEILTNFSENDKDNSMIYLENIIDIYTTNETVVGFLQHYIDETLENEIIINIDDTTEDNIDDIYYACYIFDIYKYIYTHNEESIDISITIFYKILTSILNPNEDSFVIYCIKDVYIYFDFINEILNFINSSELLVEKFIELQTKNKNYIIPHIGNLVKFFINYIKENDKRFLTINAIRIFKIVLNDLSNTLIFYKNYDMVVFDEDDIEGFCESILCLFSIGDIFENNFITLVFLNDAMNYIHNIFINIESDQNIYDYYIAIYSNNDCNNEIKAIILNKIFENPDQQYIEQFNQNYNSDDELLQFYLLYNNFISSNIEASNDYKLLLEYLNDILKYLDNSLITIKTYFNKQEILTAEHIDELTTPIIKLFKKQNIEQDDEEKEQCENMIIEIIHNNYFIDIYNIFREIPNNEESEFITIYKMLQEIYGIIEGEDDSSNIPLVLLQQNEIEQNTIIQNIIESENELSVKEEYIDDITFSDDEEDNET